MGRTYHTSSYDFRIRVSPSNRRTRLRELQVQTREGLRLAGMGAFSGEIHTQGRWNPHALQCARGGCFLGVPGEGAFCRRYTQALHRFDRIFTPPVRSLFGTHPPPSTQLSICRRFLLDFAS